MHPYRAVVTLTSSESKRLIAKGVAALPEVHQALAMGRMIIGNGTTNAFVAEELLGVTILKLNYAAGIIAEGKLWVTEPEVRLQPHALVDGQQVDTPWQQVLADFEGDDVFIKGANAVDPDGLAGVLVAQPEGGTTGAMLGIVASRGSHLIVPVGLEKLIPSVLEAADHLGIKTTNRVIGLPCGLIPLTGARVITELEALEELFDVEAYHVASGGIAGSEGAVVIAIEGDQEEVDAAFALVESIKGEAPVMPE